MPAFLDCVTREGSLIPGLREEKQHTPGAQRSRDQVRILGLAGPAQAYLRVRVPLGQTLRARGSVSELSSGRRGLYFERVTLKISSDEQFLKTRLPVNSGAASVCAAFNMNHEPGEGELSCYEKLRAAPKLPHSYPPRNFGLNPWSLAPKAHQGSLPSDLQELTPAINHP